MARLSFSVDPRAFDRFAQGARAQMAGAATAAIGDAGAQADRELRTAFAGAGLSRRFAAAQRLDVFPRGRASLDAAAVLRNRIPFSGTIAEGATIPGKPLLWLPIDDNLPVAPGGVRWTPARYAAAAGPLFTLHRRSGAPLLGVRRAGRTVPVFVGVPQVTIRKHVDVPAIIARAAAQLARLFTQHLKS